jgi:dihydropyrimidinase
MKAKDPDGRGSLATWNASRPPFVEADAVQRACYVAGIAGAPIYIVHTTSAEALQAALRHRRAGTRVFIETCPHYLTHDIEWAGGDIGKINPPLREKSDRQALWQALRDGHVNTVATDHVHRDVSSKAGGIWAASPGCPGLETLLPVLISEGHHKHGLSLERVSDLVSGAPSQIMGVASRKGSISVGCDADLTFVDLNAEWKMDANGGASSAGYSIYADWKFKGRVVHATSRGQWILKELALVDDMIGNGKYVQRKLAEKPS